MIEVDYEYDRALIAGQWFPACSVICPPYAGHTDDPASRILFAHRGRDELTHPDTVVADFAVPLENGALVNITEQIGENPGIWLSIDSRYCERSRDLDDPLWLPIMLHPIDKILCGCSKVSHWKHFDRCEPDWVAEAIQRWATYEVVDGHCNVESPQLQIIRLAQARAMLDDYWTARRG